MKLTIRLKMYKFARHGDHEKITWPVSFLGYQCIVHSPDLFSLRKYGSDLAVNFLWYLFTFGRFKIVTLIDGKNVAHYSYITPKTFRFPFMAKNDIMIGPCFTDSKYRGKGIFTEILRLINSIYCDNDLWICANLNNKASLRAFESSGYKFYSLAKISRLTKIVTLIE
jgi:hypothetical protein